MRFAALLALALTVGEAQVSLGPVPPLPAPTRDAPPLTEAEKAIINAGIALLDEQKPELAIAKYREVLAANPDSAGAMYEIALALTQKGDYATAVEMAAKSASYRSVDLDKCLALVGTAFDMAGEPKKAIEAYERGLAILPNAGTLHYNKAVAELQGLKDPERAIASLKRGAMADPSHASTHWLLGQLFLSSDLRTPALLALSRFLILEPSTRRGSEGFKTWYTVLYSNVQPGADGKLEIRVNPDKPTREGDVTRLDMFLAMAQIEAASADAGTPPGVRLTAQMKKLLNAYTAHDPGKDADTFLFAYYMPYFKALAAKGFVEPFVYHAARSAGMPGASDWLSAHGADVEAFLAWDKAYVWR